MSSKRAAILLVAGQGTRMGRLTINYPKCLLPVGEITVLDTLLTELLKCGEREIVLVTGHQSSVIESWIEENYAEANIKLAHNNNYKNDVNILSVEKGVSALNNPEYGYTIIETDVLLDPRVWPLLAQAEMGSESFWLTHGYYSPCLTGGIVEASKAEPTVKNIAYVPHYDSAFDGWMKMVGLLSVSPEQVDNDRRLRQIFLQKSTQQYYMAPWIVHRSSLPCRAVDITDFFARSFNEEADYRQAVEEYILLLENFEALK